MTTLTFVKSALKRGKRDQAVYTLRRILHYSPTAEAHYIAARLTNKRRLKVRHLKKALKLDPTYEPAAKLLHLVQSDPTEEIQALRQELNAASPPPQNPVTRFFDAIGNRAGRLSRIWQ